MKFFRLLLTVGVLCISANSVQASILGSHLSFDGLADVFIDDSRADFLNNDGSVDGFGIPTLTAGDDVYGFVSVSDNLLSPIPTNTIGPSSDEIAFLFGFRVTGTVASQDGTSYFTHGAIPAAAGGLAGLLDPAFAPVVTAGIAPLGATTFDAAFVVISNPGTDDPLAPEIVNTGSLSAFIPGDGWGYEATGGFDPTAGSLDFLHLETTGSARTERGGFTIFDHPFGGGVGFNGVSVTRFGDDITGPPFPPTSVHDIVLTGTISPLSAPSPGGWIFDDSSDFTLNPTPEPISLLVWAGLAAMAVSVRRRFAS